MQDWVETFKSWARPPSEAEEDKASRAANMINEAIRASPALSRRSVAVYATGSYRNNTNVRLSSDVDVAIVLMDTFFYDIPVGAQPAIFGVGASAVYGLRDFRKDVGEALTAKFGRDATSGTKTFDIAENGGRLAADATPFLHHRRYDGTRNPDGSWRFIDGVETRPTNAPEKRIINWHQQHYANGVAKNDATKRRFKRVARILKRARVHMEASGTAKGRAAAVPMASFLLESLVYNCPNTCFAKQEGSYFEDVRSVISQAFHATKGDAEAASLVEVNNIKPLFGSHQSWTRAATNAFLQEAWQHLGFK